MKKWILSFFFVSASALTLNHYSFAQHVVGGGGDGCAAEIRFIAKEVQAQLSMEQPEILDSIGDQALDLLELIYSGSETKPLIEVVDGVLLDPVTGFPVPFVNDGVNKISVTKNWCGHPRSMQRRVEVFHEYLSLLRLEKSQDYTYSSQLFKKRSPHSSEISKISCDKTTVVKGGLLGKDLSLKDEDFILYNFESGEENLDGKWLREKRSFSVGKMYEYQIWEYRRSWIEDERGGFAAIRLDVKHQSKNLLDDSTKIINAQQTFWIQPEFGRKKIDLYISDTVSIVLECQFSY